MSANTADGRLARRWFWTLLLMAVASMGVLYAGIKARQGLSSAIFVLTSSLLLLASTGQAARIALALALARGRLPADARRAGYQADDDSVKCRTSPTAPKAPGRRTRSQRSTAPAAPSKPAQDVTVSAHTCGNDDQG
jgi:hypothetical protein